MAGDGNFTATTMPPPNRSVKGLSASTAYPTARSGQTSYTPSQKIRKHQQWHTTRAGRASRQLLKIIVALTCCLILLSFLVWPSNRPRLIVSATQSEDHHIDKSMLIMTLNRSQSTEPSVRVTVTNLHYSTSISLLIWDSPFDEAAVALGVFTLADHETGNEIKSSTIKLDRILAAKKDDFLELLPRHAVTKDVAIKSPGLSLEAGRNYNVQVRGQWRAVWHADANIMGEERLRLMGGPTGLINWSYESNVYKLHVW